MFWQRKKLCISWVCLGLTRPELAVVLAYSKIWLSNHLLDSDLPDDPYFATAPWVDAEVLPPPDRWPRVEIVVNHAGAWACTACPRMRASGVRPSASARSTLPA